MLNEVLVKAINEHRPTCLVVFDSKSKSIVDNHQSQRIAILLLNLLIPCLAMIEYVGLNS